MKKLLGILSLATLPLAAQSFEVGAFVGQQSYKDYDVTGPGGSLSVRTESKTVAAVRLGYSLVDLGPALFQVTVGFQPEATTTAKVTGALIASGDYKQSYASVGAMFNFKAVVALGAGLEYRSEKLSDGGTSTTYGRPWARANLGFAFPTPLVKPFLGLEVAAPLSSKSNDVSSAEEILKSWAPKLQIGLYAGIRF